MKKLSVCWIVMGFSLLVALPSLADAAARIALVIGNSNYKSAPLKNPANDAQDMSDTLRDLNFDVIEKIDADKRAMVKAVNTFGKKLHKSDVGIFFYAGHGMQFQGRNFLIPVGARVKSESDVEFEGVHAGRILGKMEEADNKLNIVILDACRDNPFKRSFRTSEKGLAQMNAPIGSIVAYATSPGSVAADGSGRNGVYTKHLLSNLESPDLSVQEVFTRTGLEVMKETGRKQVPWTSSTPVEKFYLAGADAVVEQPSADSSGTGTLKVRTTPTDAKVFIDSRFKGKSPKDIHGLEAGSHTIRAEKDGYEPEKKQVRVRSGRTSTVRLYLEKEEQTGRLYVHPTPDDAEVKIMNIGPPYHDGIELDPGKYQVRVEKNGYETREQWESVRVGEDLDVYIELEQKQKASVSSKPSPGDTWTDPVTGMEFVWVPSGCYMMGQTESERQYLIDERGKDKYKKYYSDERPRHKVCVDGFWMGKTEVTRGQFRKFVKASRYRTDADKAGKAYIFNKDTDWNWKKKSGYNWEKTGYSQTDRHPAACVSWNDAKAFAKWLSERTGKEFRLPTEAEWEYAARGGTKTMRFWGDDESDACRYASIADEEHGWKNAFPCDDGYEFTAPVGSFQPNPFGLHDMLGNVWEWCEDVYDDDAYTKHSRNNPLVASGGSRRVFRGGSWYNSPRNVRAANRNWGPADDAGNNLGFRLCLSRVR